MFKAVSILKRGGQVFKGLTKSTAAVENESKRVFIEKEADITFSHSSFLFVEG